MALVYKRSTENAARSYERSPGMEPNPGVTALSVVHNPGSSDQEPESEPEPEMKGHYEATGTDETERNPFQWIRPRGKRHTHTSVPYKTLRGALRWKERSPERAKGARLYAVDEYGTVVSGAIRRRAQKNPRRKGMAYNIGALRRAMRANFTPGFAAQKPLKRRGKRRAFAGAAPALKRRQTRPTARQVGRYRGKKRRAAKKAAMTRARKKAARRRAALKGWRKRKTKRRVARRGRRKTKRGVRARARRATRRAAPRRARRVTRRGVRRRRRRVTRYFGGQAVRMTGRPYIDKYLARGLIPAVARVGRTRAHKSGKPYIMSYGISRGMGRTTRRRTRRRVTRRAYAIGATYRGRRARRMLAANRRRRRSRRRLTMNRGRRTTRSRHGRRRRRMSRNWRVRGGYTPNRRRRRRRLTRNLLAASKVRWTRGRRGRARMGRAGGRLFQLVEFGPRSRGRRTKRGTRRQMRGYPTLVPAHVSLRGYVRKFRFGGAAKAAHRRRLSMRRNPKYVVVNRRRRRSRRRYSRNPRYVVVNRRRRRRSRRMTMNRRHRRRRSRRYTMNRRHRSRRSRRRMTMNRRRGRRRLRRNQFLGINWMTDVVTPVLGGTAGFVGARLLGGGLAQIGAIRNILDKDKPAEAADNTRIAANVLGIIATFGVARFLPIVRRHQGSIVTGMGLSLADRLLRKVTGPVAAYLGEYVEQPLGEYVEQPLGLGAYVVDPSAGMGEYVEQPLGAIQYAAAGMGETMYAAAGFGNQDDVDGLMDVMEAAAGDIQQAAAGMGDIQYAAAGLGAGPGVALDIARGVRSGLPRVGFRSTETPVDVARDVTRMMPYTRPVPTSIVTPEGKGYAGGLFARHLFAGMAGG